MATQSPPKQRNAEQDKPTGFIPTADDLLAKDLPRNSAPTEVCEPPETPATEATPKRSSAPRPSESSLKPVSLDSASETVAEAPS